MQLEFSFLPQPEVGTCFAIKSAGVHGLVFFQVNGAVCFLVMNVHKKMIWIILYIVKTVHK